MPEHPAQSSDMEQLLPAGFRVSKWLGVGNFGKVCRAKGQGGFECAFKIIEMTLGKAAGIKEFRALRVIRRIKPHRNLIEYLGVWLVTSEGEILDNADQIEDDDLQKLDVAELIIQMPLAVKSLEVRLKEARREFKAKTDRQPGDLPGIALPELLPYMRGVAEALDHLHAPIHPLSEKGLGWLMHRDIKPANLLIDRTGNVLVADYGVARAVGTNVKSTQSGAGTPIYSAPEQITDRVDVVDPASDQYSLAITYYELRTGMLPFKDDVLGDVNSLKLAHTLGKLDFSLLPRNEVNVLKRATHRTVNQRYPSCVEFIDELWKANGVTPMQSGFIQRPLARIPVSDSSPDFGPTPPAQATPAKDTREKTGSRTPFELGTVPEMKPSLREPEEPPPVKRAGTLLLGDLVRSTPFHTAPFPPTTSDENLPIADEATAAPWEHSPPKSKSKSSIDINAEPAKGSWHPAAPKPKSNGSIDLDSSPQTGTSTWHGGGEDLRRAKKSPMLLIGGGIVVAALVAGGIVIALNKPNDSGTAKNDDPKPTKKDEPADDAPANFKQALAHLQDVGTGGIAKVDLALPLLKAVKPDYPELGKPAQALHAEWSALRALLVKPKPTLDDAETIAGWVPPDGIAQYESEIRLAYRDLKLKNPTAGLRFQIARSFVRSDNAFASVLGLPAAIDFPSLGMVKLGELVDLNPDAAIGKPASGLLKVWTASLKYDRDFTAIAARDVTLKDLTDGRDAASNAVEGIALETDDHIRVQSFYRVRLAHLIQRFALKPIGLTTAKEWSGIEDKLPSLKAGDSPWLELLVAEGAFLANALETPVGKAEVKMPAASRLESLELRAYRTLLKAELDWQNAKTLTQRREAAQNLMDALVVGRDFLDVDVRKVALGAVLATAANRDFKQAITLPDTPYADEKSAETARKCLVQAHAYLQDNAELQMQVRRDLLRSAAFPKVDPATAKLAALTAKDIDAGNVAERNALLLAFVRTRDLKTAGGVADAIAGYDKISQAALAALKDIDTDLVPLVKIADSLKQFLADVPDEHKADAAKLFLPLVQALFQRRKQLKADEKTLLADLAGTAWKIAKTDDLEVLYSFVRLEVKGETVDVASAEKLHDRRGNGRTRALLGLVQLRKAKTETNAVAKLALLEDGTKNVEKAIELLKADDPDNIVNVLATDSLLAHVELGRSYVQAKEYKNALASLDKVENLAGKSKDSEELLNSIQLPRAKCNWYTASTRTDAKLALAKADLTKVASRTGAESTEAKYWLALMSLYTSKLIKCDPADFHYEADKNLLMDPASSTPGAEWTADESWMKNPPTDRDPYATEYLEWRACYACAKSNAANQMKSANRNSLRTAALKELDELTKADALCGAVRRLQFLAYRIQTASRRSGDEEMDVAELQAAWRPADPMIASLQSHAAASRLPGSVDRNIRLQSAYLNLARIHAVGATEQKKPPSVRDVKAALDALAKLKPDANEVVRVFDTLGLQSARDAAGYDGVKNTEYDIAASAVAIQCFDFVLRFDPDMKLVFALHDPAAVGAGSFRDYVATRTEREIKIAVDKLKDNPETVDLLIQIDASLEQAERLLKRLPNPTDAEKGRRELAIRNRNKLKEDWFDKGLDAAIADAKAAGNRVETITGFPLAYLMQPTLYMYMARVKAWTEFKTKRYGKP